MDPHSNLNDPRVRARLADPSDPPLYFRSNTQVRVAPAPPSIKEGDLVLRLLCNPTASAGGSIQVNHDIYDGPWRISELPGDNSETVQELQGREQVAGISSKVKVKLRFPKGSKADPWTEIGRLIPSKRVISTKRCEFELSNGVTVAAPYVTSESPAGDNMFEVQRLRGKRIRFLQGEETRGMKWAVDDNWVRIYKLSGGPIRVGEMAVVEFLVHWAGWPSEDDSWEPGQDIPQIFRDEFHSTIDPWRNYDVQSDGPMQDLSVLF